MSSSEVHEGRRLPTKLVTLARDSQSARTAYGWCGPEQVDRLICCSMKHLVGSYRWMLHANFASLVPRMPRRAREGFKMIAVYQYCDDRWESRNEVFIVPSEFPTVDNQDAGIYIYASTEHTPPEIPNKVKKRMSKVKETGEAFIHSSGGFDELLSSKEFINHIYDSLREDVEQAMGWSEIGRERSNHWANRSIRFVAQNPGMSIATDFTTYSNYFDWPAL